ncbi:MAG: FkbM family methyltransferase [Ilumatobacter sp.]|uniref:FkbM family methyltransferase n=1 Tax=Ilumatobacter sp. TaxID=1967498 RepID=UPI00329A433E
MAYYTPLPSRPNRDGPERFLNIVDGKSSAVQRALRRDGLAGYEPPTMAAILAALEMQTPGFTFFDVGANIGLYSSLCATLFDPAHVVAFEPTPTTALIAAKIARINHTGARLEEIALGREPGTARLYLSATSDSSNSLVEGFKKNVGTVDVEVEPLDSFVQRTSLVPDVVKIDAETFEPEILAGARRTLDEHRPLLIVEVLNRRGHDHGEEMMAAMDGLGYSYYHCSTYSDWQPAARITGDETGAAGDWLFAATPLPPAFRASVEAWEEAVSRCTADRNTSVLPDPENVVAQPLLDRARDLYGRTRRLIGR